MEFLYFYFFFLAHGSSSFVSTIIQQHCISPNTFAVELLLHLKNNIICNDNNINDTNAKSISLTNSKKKFNFVDIDNCHNCLKSFDTNSMAPMVFQSLNKN